MLVGVFVGSGVTEGVYVGSPGKVVGSGVAVAVGVDVMFNAVATSPSLIARIRLPPRMKAEKNAVNSPAISSRPRFILHALGIVDFCLRGAAIH